MLAASKNATAVKKASFDFANIIKDKGSFIMPVVAKLDGRATWGHTGRHTGTVDTHSLVKQYKLN